MATTGPLSMYLTSPGKNGLTQVSIVLLKVFLTRPHHPDSHKLKSLLFKSLDDLSNKSSLNSIRFDHDEGPFLSLLGLETHGTKFSDVDRVLGRRDQGRCRCWRDLELVIFLLGKASCNKTGSSSCHSCQNS